MPKVGRFRRAVNRRADNRSWQRADNVEHGLDEQTILAALSALAFAGVWAGLGGQIVKIARRGRQQRRIDESGMARRLAQACQRREDMHLGAARVLEPDQAFRRSIVALAELLPSLSKAETRELSRLTRATYASVPWKSRRRLADYIELVRRGETTDPAVDTEMAELMKPAELELSPDQRHRLQEYYELAIRRTFEARSAEPAA